MNTLTRTARRNATSILHTRFPTTTFIARKSTLTQVFSDKATRRNTSLLPSFLCVPVCTSTNGITATSPNYSQAIKANDFVFLSAQIPTDSNSKLISGGVRAQAEKMIENARVVLEEAGSGLGSVVKVNVSTEERGWR
jgi:2-iminobutanoate/2-iminopropanoate deaminase